MVSEKGGRSYGSIVLADALTFFGSRNFLAHRVRKSKYIQKIVQKIVFRPPKTRICGLQKRQIVPEKGGRSYGSIVLADALTFFGSSNFLAHRVRKSKYVQKNVQNIVF